MTESNTHAPCGHRHPEMDWVCVMSAGHATDHLLRPATDVVHVHRGRLRHLDDGTLRMRTLCDRAWVASVTAPPATDREMCPTCEDCARG